jgi:pimeloyl-ACP methyl ester carboxylesterase
MVLAEIVPEDQRIPMGPTLARIRDFATRRAIPAPHEAVASDKKLPPAAAEPSGKIEPPYDRLSAREQRLHQWAESLPGLDDAETSQKDWSSEYMAKFYKVPQEGILRDMPLVVLTRAVGGYGDYPGVSAAELEERKRLQAALARLSTRGVQLIVPGGHNLHLENPDAVADAIHRVYDQARAH